MASQAKKTSSKKADDPSPVERNVIDFNAFRERAKDVDAPKTHDIAPYVVGPVEAKWPTDLRHEIALINAMRAMNNGTDEYAFLDILRILFGDAGFRYLLDQFNKESDKYVLLVGLVRNVTDHFQGQGASKVPGGTPAS